MKYGKEIGTGILTSVVATEIFVTGLLVGKVIENNSQSAEAYPADTPSASAPAVNSNDGFEKFGPKGGGPMAEQYNAATMRVLVRSGQIIMSEIIEKEGSDACVIAPNYQGCFARTIVPKDGVVPGHGQDLIVGIMDDYVVVERQSRGPTNSLRSMERFTLNLPENNLVKNLAPGAPVTADMLGEILNQDGVTVGSIDVSEGNGNRYDTDASYYSTTGFGYQGYHSDHVVGDGLYLEGAPSQYGNYVAGVLSVCIDAHLNIPRTPKK